MEAESLILIVIRRLSDTMHTATPTHAYIRIKRLESSEYTEWISWPRREQTDTSSYPKIRMTKGTACDSILEGREQPPQGPEGVKGVVKTALWPSGHLCPSTWPWISCSHLVLRPPRPHMEASGWAGGSGGCVLNTAILHAYNIQGQEIEIKGHMVASVPC